jgi:mannosyltransferase OCH1-like enzyme
MFKKVVLSLFLLGVVWFGFSIRQNPFLPFDASMKKMSAKFESNYFGKKGKQWKILKSLYEKNLSKKPLIAPRIPKIIHQIWIGGKLPEKYLPLQKSWKEKHPDWEYRLWTDADLPSFPFVNRDRFERAINVGEKADILRYEILNKFGGLYVDTDFECIQCLDPLHHLCDLYVGLEGAFAQDQEACMLNSLIGSIPHHPIIECCLKLIAKKPAGKMADEVQSISGPGCFRRAFFKCYKEKNLKNVAFPCTFFYPLSSHERCGHLDEMAKSNWIHPETFGIHYWDVSWASKPFN